MSENRIGLKKTDYTGKPSTLCKGCGHDSITNAIVSSYFELGVQPHMVAKLSGIGCSSKTPTYFIERGHGFNGVHGRMPSLATGANLANRDLKLIGVSGDGDTGSIGFGQFCHMVRRNVDCTYIVENNGTYGLTKGQFSATADEGTKSKKGVVNPFPVLDLCALAVESGASFVARSFSGDRKQVMTLLKAANAHAGTAMVDIISPCVTFNNHDGSTKSYTYFKEHGVPIHNLDFVPSFENIEVDMKDGEVRTIEMHDGSKITLKKLDSGYDATDKLQALKAIEEAKKSGQILTGILYINPDAPDLVKILEMTKKPLYQLEEKELDPGADILKKVNAGLK